MPVYWKGIKRDVYELLKSNTQHMKSYSHHSQNENLKIDICNKGIIDLSPVSTGLIVTISI